MSGFLSLLKKYRIIIPALLGSLYSVLLAQPEPESRVLKSETLITVHDEDKVIVSEKQEILVARKADVHLGNNSLRETDFIELMDMDAALYDLNGKELKELENKDIIKSSVSYYSLYDAHNTISYTLTYPVVPYLVKKEMKYKIKSSFFTPDWDPQENVPVDYARLEIILQKPLEYTFTKVGGIGEPVITTDSKGYKHHVWEVKDVPKYEGEYLSAPESRFQLGVKCQAVKFNLDGFEGSVENWQSFGSWYYNLIKDRIVFSPDINTGESFKSIPDVKERVKKIYEKLQQETRYVQVYLGIDGWRPHHVDKVHQVKYGDCKDLSAYMLAMLKQAGITGYLALVKTRDTGLVDKNLPGSKFNHMIAVVPLPDDTVYLECTSNVTSVDDLHEDIEGIDILLIKPHNSVLIRTPLSRAEMNKSVLKATAQVLPDRSLDLKGKITLTGNQAIQARGFFKTLEDKKKREWIINRLAKGSGNVKINAFTIDSLNNPYSPLYINFEAHLQYFAKKAGNRFIFEPGIYHQVYFEGEKPEKRKMPLLNPSAFTDIDSIYYIFPDGFDVKNEVKIEPVVSGFGRCEMAFSRQENGGALYTSTFNLNDRYIELGEYESYYNFMESCKSEIKAKIVISQ
ncbi:MAG: transglutaminase domain-containing protein [Calditrichaceae bacterium]|nr:transglutaminase domain-containing protein [Calditrichaceae bacterium]MBN2709521.1 transglutaminase domain-containing protein [Calditrichaceae bacterium]RQV93129.1 MAG: transglutaminase domain-containing protein [Calditrichota bacterium]